MMQPLSRTTTTAPRSGTLSRRSGKAPALWVALGVVACLVAAYALVALGHVYLALRVSAIGAAIAIAWGLPFSLHLSVPGVAPKLVVHIGPGDPDLYLDLDAIQVEAVYVLGAEVFARLRGGMGRRLDPLTGDQRHIETSDISLTWRCRGLRSAAKLAERLNQWEARGTQLRLLAARGHCALLIEDDQNWLALPEMRIAR